MNYRLRILSILLIVLFQFNPTKAQSPNTGTKTFRVLNYNIHHANPPSKPGLIDHDAIAKVIREADPDVVTLQEVDHFTKRNGSVDQTREIARRTGMKYKFFRAIDHDGGEYGLAILSKRKLKDVKLVPLPDKVKGESRILAYGSIKAGGQKVIIANTHLEAGKGGENRKVQMERIVEEFGNLKTPVIICGDFNSMAGSEVVDLLDKHFTRTCIGNCPGTIPQINPTKTIDFIAGKNLSWNLIEHRVIDEPYASDHLPVLAVFALPR